MVFDALYETENEADDGYRVIEAASLRDAKAVLNGQLQAEGTHGRYRIDAIIETAASFVARRAA